MFDLPFDDAFDRSLDRPVDADLDPVCFDRLEELLDPFEARADFAFAQDRELELADRSRAEYRTVTLAARLLASVDDELAVAVTGVGVVAGVLERAAQTWFEMRGRRRWIVCRSAVGSVTGASGRSVPEVAWPASAGLGLGAPLRELASEGSRVRLHLLDGGQLDGVLLRVGADFAEARTGSPERLVLVPFDALAAVSGYLL